MTIAPESTVTKYYISLNWKILILQLQGLLARWPYGKGCLRTSRARAGTVVNACAGMYDPAYQSTVYGINEEYETLAKSNRALGTEPYVALKQVLYLFSFPSLVQFPL